MIVKRASDFYIKIRLTNENADGIILGENDKLIFAVKKDYHTNSEENTIIRKTLQEYDEILGGYPFKLTSEETDIPAGIYYYDIGLQCSNGEFYHITTADQFIIKESVARKDDTV